MWTKRAAIEAALLAGTLLVASQAALAQDTDRAPAMSGGDGSACMTAMDEMMAMMREHMGTPMMGDGRDMGPGMMGPDAGAGMMGPMGSPGMMGSSDEGCMTAMDQMMAMMREHMGASMMGTRHDTDPGMMGSDPGMMGPMPSPSPAPSTSDTESDSHASHHPGGAASFTPGDADDATRIAVRLTDGLAIEPAAMRVPVGVPVTFVVTNMGAVPHEFVIGDEAAQQAHEAKMGGMATMTHDEPTAIGLAPGETKELTVTLTEPGELLAGCHITGHYPAGMRAVITVG